MAECALLYEKNEPRILATPLAYHKMRYYIDHSDMEIGWLGYVEKLTNSIYLIEDVFLLKQKVHSTTTEIDPDALASLANDLIHKGDEGIALYNKIRMWGHSHVNMGTFASGQDDKQMEEFATSDFYIRLIGNKKNEWNVCLYDYANNILWSKLQLEIQYNVDIDDAMLQKEIEDNVSKIEYNRQPIGYNKGGWDEYIRKNYEDYYEDTNDYPYYRHDYSKQESKVSKCEEEKETKEEELPYEIEGRPTEEDYRAMARYYAQDEDQLLFMVTAIPAMVKDDIYADYGVTLTTEEIAEFQKDLALIWDRKYGRNYNEVRKEK